MSVIDASVLVDALVTAGASGEAARNELRDRKVLQVPTIFAAEAASALRGLVRRGALSPVRALSALEQIQTVRTIQYRFEPLSKRAWELHDNLSVYDAWYVALAEQLGTDLGTSDARLAGAAGARCRIRVIRT